MDQFRKSPFLPTSRPRDEHVAGRLIGSRHETDFESDDPELFQVLAR